MDLLKGSKTLAVLLTVFIGALVVAPLAHASAGSTKMLQEDGTEVTSNNPHLQGCTFTIQWSGFTGSEVIFRVQAAGGGNPAIVIPNTTVPLTDGFAQTVITFNVGNLASITPHPIQGYHLTLVGDASDTNNNGKNKTFWIEKECGQPSLGIAKERTTSSPIQVGDAADFTITVTNSGTADATNVLVTDTLPDDLTLVSISSPGGTCDSTTLVCDLGTIAQGANKTITVETTANEVGTHTNTATLANGTFAQASVVVDPAPSAIIKVVKKIASGSDPDEKFEFSAGGITWNIGELGHDGTAQIAVTSADEYTVTEDVLTGWSTPNVDCSGGAGDNTSAEVTDTATFDVKVADLTVAGTTTITCTFTNSQAPRATLKIVKEVAQGSNDTEEFSFESDFGWDPDNLKDGDDDLTTVLDPGTYEVSESVPAGWRTPMVDCDGGDGDNTSNDQTDTATFDVTADDIEEEVEIVCTFTNSELSADLSITKTDGQTSVLGGTKLTYVLTITNDGPDTATGVTVVDTIPTGTTFTTPDPVSPSQGSCDPPTTTSVSCDLGGLASGSSATITIKVNTPTVTSNTVITNVATVSANENDPDLDNNEGTDDTTLRPPVINVQSADLSIIKTDTVDPVTQGENIVYTLTVNNAGPNAAVNVIVSDSLPDGLGFVSATPSQGSCNATSPISCNLGDLLTGQSATITVVASTSSVTPGTVVNTATVSSSTPDPNLANNTDSETTTVLPPLVEGGRIVVEKRTLPSGASARFDFTGDASGRIGHGETLVVDVDPGTYAATEVQKDGWTLTKIECDDTDSSGNVGTATATFNVAEGETVRCTFTNARDEVLPGPPIEQPSGPEPQDRVKGGALPFTGGGVSGLITFGLLLLLAGTTLVLGVRRRLDPGVASRR